VGAAFAVALLLLFVGYRHVSQRTPVGPLDGLAPTVMTFSTEGERITDGVIARPGSRWNCSAASLISAGGGVEWDLGRVVPIERMFIQADNDDIYAIVGSTDRKHWKDLWEALPGKAHGLTNRKAEGLGAGARYLRVEPRGGDGYYSVSELAISSTKDGPWPPALREQAGEESEVRGERERHALVILSAVIGALAFGVARALRRRKRGDILQQPLLWVALGLSIFLIVTALAYAAKHRFNVVDDAYISLQYAKNWAQGNGLVFNPGERVEGYTNFLWTLLMTPLWPLSGGDPLLMTRLATWTALGFAVASVGLLALIGRRLFEKSSLPVVFAMLLVVFDDSFVSYPVVFALENQLLIALMLAGLALLAYRPRRWEWLLGASFALVGMTRPDGLLWGGTFLVVHAAARFLPQLLPRAEDETPLETRALLHIGAAFAGSFIVYFLARYAYYGELLPNTFHLKVGSTLDGFARGFNYLRSYVVQRSLVPLLALLAIAFSSSSWVRWLFLHAVLHAAYIAYVGGDFYAGHRFLLALTPSLALLAAVVFAHLLQLVRGGSKERTAWLRRAALAAALAAAVAVRFGTLRAGPFMGDLYGSCTTVDNNVQYMRWLKDVARPNSSMIVGDIGATGLFADVRVIDFFGVVDLAVARKHVDNFGTGKPGHEKVPTREEQLARKPTYIKWGYVGDLQRPPGYYIFNDFPRHLRVEGLWVLDDLARGQVVPDTAIRFGSHEFTNFVRSGTAFQGAPARGRAEGQSYTNGHFGPFINTFTSAHGDRATGKLVTAPFLLTGDRMRFLIGGGHDPERLRISLIIDGRREFSETGTDWETLGRREWDIAPFRGKTATIEIVDEAVGAWGHLLVDEIEQWIGTPNNTGKL
jgi:hypothetical protein